MPHSTPSRWSPSRGFTMVEVMVVVVIVAILVGFSVPMYRKYVRNSRVSEATNRMGDILTAARTFAVHNTLPNGRGQWPRSCQASGFLGDCGASENFRYSILRTGDVLTIFAFGVGEMRGVQVTMTVNGLSANGDIRVNWRTPV